MFESYKLGCIPVDSDFSAFPIHVPINLIMTQSVSQSMPLLVSASVILKIRGLTSCHVAGKFFCKCRALTTVVLLNSALRTVHESVVYESEKLLNRTEAKHPLVQFVLECIYARNSAL